MLVLMVWRTMKPLVPPAVGILRMVLGRKMVVATSAKVRTECEVNGHGRGEVDGDVLDVDGQMLLFPVDTAVASGVDDDMKLDAPPLVLHTDNEDDADDERWVAVVVHDGRLDLLLLMHFDLFQPHQVA